MTIIIDFDEWLGQADPDDFEEVYGLYHTVRDEASSVWYSCKRSRDQKHLFVKGVHTKDSLMLSSDRAKRAFLSYIIDRYCHPERDIDLWYGFQRAMASDN